MTYTYEIRCVGFDCQRNSMELFRFFFYRKREMRLYAW